MRRCARRVGDEGSNVRKFFFFLFKMCENSFFPRFFCLLKSTPSSLTIHTRTHTHTHTQFTTIHTYSNIDSHPVTFTHSLTLTHSHSLTSGGRTCLLLQTRCVVSDFWCTVENALLLTRQKVQVSEKNKALTLCRMGYVLSLLTLPVQE